MTNPSRTYLLIEDRLGEPLLDFVLALRARKTSWAAIAREIDKRTDVAITPETLRIWFFADDRHPAKAAS